MQSSSRVVAGAGTVFCWADACVWSLCPVRCFFIILLALLCLVPISFADPNEPNVVPVRLVRDFAVIVPVTVNGRGPYDFMLDTGSTISAVDRELGQELALNSEGLGTVTTLTQHLVASLALARRVDFGPITEQNVEIMIRDLSELHHMAPTARGVLGQNALNHADFLLDYQHKRLQFDTNGELVRLLGGHHVPLRRDAISDNPDYASLAVRADITDNGVHPTDFLLDSGTPSPVIFGDLNATGGNLEGLVADIEGRQSLTGVRNLHLEIDGKLRVLPTNVLRFQSAGRGIGGLLPTRIFSRLYISNTGGFAIFEPKMKKPGSLDRMLANLPPQAPGHGPKS